MNELLEDEEEAIRNDPGALKLIYHNGTIKLVQFGEAVGYLDIPPSKAAILAKRLADHGKSYRRR